MWLTTNRTNATRQVAVLKCGADVRQAQVRRKSDGGGTFPRDPRTTRKCLKLQRTELSSARPRLFEMNFPPPLSLPRRVSYACPLRRPASALGPSRAPGAARVHERVPRAQTARGGGVVRGAPGGDDLRLLREAPGQTSEPRARKSETEPLKLALVYSNEQEDSVQKCPQESTSQ